MTNQHVSGTGQVARADGGGMDSCDVLIVGGGPAGASCAWKLRRSGLDVVVMDRAVFPRDKVCAGWITPEVFTLLEIAPDDYGRGRVLQPIRGFRIGLIGGGQVMLPYGQTVSYGIRRCEFDHYLLNRIDARLRLQEPLGTLVRRRDHWIANGNLRAAVVVGAGGHFCPVARILGNQRRDRSNVVVAQEAEFEVAAETLTEQNIDPEIPELFFCDDLKGYGWCVRKANYLNVGLGRLDPRGLAERVAAFGDFLRQIGKVRGPIRSRFRGHAYRVYQGTSPQLLDDQMLLIGDAAGLAYAQSGEGIRPAIESGLIAADVIIGARGDYRRRNLAPYRTRLTTRLGRPRRIALTDRLPAPWVRFLAPRLLATRWFSRHVVLDRWFLRRSDAHPLFDSAGPV